MLEMSHISMKSHGFNSEKRLSDMLHSKAKEINLLHTLPLNTAADISELLKECVHEFCKIYKEKLIEVILIGSYARGDYNEDSDVDIVLLLKTSNEDLITENELLCEVAAELDYKYNALISTITLDASMYYKYRSVHCFYRNIQDEGVVLYAA